jgi:hypothetical protein
MKRSLLLAGIAVIGLAAGVAIAGPDVASTFGVAPAAAQERGDQARPHPGRFGWHRGPGFERVCGPDRAERLEDMLVVAQRRLALTDAQRPAWNNLATALRQASAKVGATCETVKAGLDDKSAPARLARMETVAQTGAEIVHAVRPSFDAFYAGLSADQKTRLDALMAHRRH